MLERISFYSDNVRQSPLYSVHVQIQIKFQCRPRRRKVKASVCLKRELQPSQGKTAQIKLIKNTKYALKK